MSKKNPDQIFKSIALDLLTNHLKDIFPESSLLKVESEYNITAKFAHEGKPTRRGTAYTIGDLREGKRKPMAYSNSGPLKAVSVCQFDQRAPIHAQLQAPQLTTFEPGENGAPDRWVRRRLIDLPPEQRVARPYRVLPKDLKDADNFILAKTLQKPIPNLFDVMETYGRPEGWSGRDIMERFLNWRRALAARFGNKLLVSQDFTLLHEGGIYVMGFNIPEKDVSFVVLMHVVQEEKPEAWRLDNSMKTANNGEKFLPTPGSGGEERYGTNRPAVEVDAAAEAVEASIKAAEAAQ